MNILIIGGTGVISYDVARLAVQNGFDVTILNRGLHRDRMPRGASLLTADITDLEEVQLRAKSLRFDVVVDFLSYTPAQLERTMRLFAGKCMHYIFISSATVYGEKKPGVAITEMTPANNHRWAYAQSKIACEKTLEQFCLGLDLPYTIVRPYVTYGDTRIPFAVIPRGRHWSLMRRILQGKPIILWDDGSALCTLTHSADFAEGLLGLCGNTMAYNTAFHVTSDETFTWCEVLSIIADTVGMIPVVVHIPSCDIENELPEMEHELSGDKATNMVFDNAKLRRAVPGFTCKIPFREGLARTIAYFQSHPEMMTVDYRWDARIDRLIHRHCRVRSVGRLQRLTLGNVAGKDQTLRQKLAYYDERYDLVANAKRALLGDALGMTRTLMLSCRDKMRVSRMKKKL